MTTTCGQEEVGKFDLFLRQGATYRRVFLWKDSDGNPRDLTGWSAEARIGSIWESDLETGDDAGTITVVVSAAATAGFDFEALEWLLRMTDPDNEVQDLLEGSAILERVAAGV